ncbi:MAG TPA: D-2-hydroxyacid dehydrogenase [Ktedonobacterales bacterium]|jgi:phosphoglycerate dehydrogenase-like enzyme|nr:D-2-hydroxyacid dehydrogenase [Ktedonobacterales bacterium]
MPDHTDNAEQRRDPQDITLLVTNYPFEPADVERLRAAVGVNALLTTRGAQELAETLARRPETDVVCLYMTPENILDLAPNLRWVALSSAGAEHALRQAWTHSPHAPLITTANGVHATPISEHVFSAMLLWARHWPEMFRLQQERRWPKGGFFAHELVGRELEGATLLVVGLGAIGRRVAQVGRAFGMRTIATRRSASAGATDPDVDEMFPQNRLDDALAQADYIVLAVPSTPETTGLINAERLAHVKRGALLVNIARGAVVDEPALIAALNDGRLGGAALDVAAQEPLPPESPLWAAPNIIISPHVSGRSARYSERLTDLMLDNIARYREGRPLRNLVDVARGY